MAAVSGALVVFSTGVPLVVSPVPSVAVSGGSSAGQIARAEGVHFTAGALAAGVIRIARCHLNKNYCRKLGKLRRKHKNQERPLRSGME